MASEKNIMRRSHQLLLDAMIMLEEIERARSLPAHAQVQNQYVALGNEIREYLRGEGEIS